MTAAVEEMSLDQISSAIRRCEHELVEIKAERDEVLVELNELRAQLQARRPDNIGRELFSQILQSVKEEQKCSGGQAAKLLLRTCEEYVARLRERSAVKTA